EEQGEDRGDGRGPLAEPAGGLPYLPLLQRTRRQQQIEGVTHRVTEREVPVPAGYSVRRGAVPEQQHPQHEQPDQPYESPPGSVAVPDHAGLQGVPYLCMPAAPARHAITPPVLGQLDASRGVIIASAAVHGGELLVRLGQIPVVVAAELPPTCLHGTGQPLLPLLERYPGHLD